MKFLRIIDEWQDKRFLWMLMSAVTLGLTCLAHYLFQDYLYMEACEQCVYIRYAMIVMAIGGLVAMSCPTCSLAKFVGYSLGIYGAVIGIGFCLTLDNIHTAVHGENPFGGVEGCREIPLFPFNLKLYEWAPGWFLPTGECGFDNPIVPEDAYGKLNKFQEFFVGTEANDFNDGLYSEGWYLIPSMKFMNMANACLLAFLSCLAALALMMAGYVSRAGAKSKIVSILSIVVVIALVVLGNMYRVPAA